MQAVAEEEGEMDIQDEGTAARQMFAGIVWMRPRLSGYQFGGGWGGRVGENANRYLLIGGYHVELTQASFKRPHQDGLGSWLLCPLMIFTSN
jgi:hypothetical protein